MNFKRKYIKIPIAFSIKIVEDYADI